MNRLASRTLLIASLAGALAAAPSVFAGEGQDAKTENAHCYGVNKCKGTGDCGGKGHSCAGKNACKRQGYVDMDKETCLRLDGGRLTPEPEAQDTKPASDPKSPKSGK